MTYEEAHAFIKDRFESLWAGRCLIVWDSQEPKVSGLKDWVRLSVQDDVGGLAGFGGAGANLYRREGFVQCQIFTAAGEYDRVSLAHKDAFVAIFEGQRFDGIRGGGILRQSEPRHDGTWLMRLVSIAFEFDQIK